MVASKIEKTILITGVAGFIGYSLAKYLSENNKYRIVGIDNINDYYDINLKKDRLADLDKVVFLKKDLNDTLDNIFEEYNIDVVINLAAQAGVRYARENPDSYIKSNVTGFYNLLETSRKYGVEKFLYASSSSVYGANKSIPYSEDQKVSTPMSLYAATKLANESIAASYFYSFSMRTIGLRFFSVYGPWGRPDMAYFKWTNHIVKGEPIELYDNGEMWRDLTYIDDIIASIAGLLDSELETQEPEIYNIGNDSPVKVADILDYIVSYLNTEPVIISKPRNPEEAVKTWADTSRLDAVIGRRPHTDYRDGLKNFLDWHTNYYR